MINQTPEEKLHRFKELMETINGWAGRVIVMIIEKKWPFKLGTTSFIDPGPIVDNVKKLGLVFDEIELLVFESLPFMTKNGPVPVLPSPMRLKS